MALEDKIMDSFGGGFKGYWSRSYDSYQDLYYVVTRVKYDLESSAIADRLRANEHDNYVTLWLFGHEGTEGSLIIRSDNALVFAFNSYTDCSARYCGEHSSVDDPDGFRELMLEKNPILVHVPKKKVLTSGAEILEHFGTEEQIKEEMEYIYDNGLGQWG